VGRGSRGLRLPRALEKRGEAADGRARARGRGCTRTVRHLQSATHAALLAGRQARARGARHEPREVGRQRNVRNRRGREGRRPPVMRAKHELLPRGAAGRRPPAHAAAFVPTEAGPNRVIQHVAWRAGRAHPWVARILAAPRDPKDCPWLPFADGIRSKKKPPRRSRFRPHPVTTLNLILCPDLKPGGGERGLYHFALA
jgi:hypothetical protein